MDLFAAYVTLGTSKNSTYKEIRKRYLQLAKQHHPDKHQGSKESIKKFQDIEYAYKLITENFSKPVPVSKQVPVSRPKPPEPKPKPKPPEPKPPEPKFKKGQNLDDFLNDLFIDGHKKTGKKKDRW